MNNVESVAIGMLFYHIFLFLKEIFLNHKENDNKANNDNENNAKERR